MQAKELQSLKFINRHMLERFIGLGNFMSYYMLNGRHILHLIIKISNSYLPYSNRKLLLPNKEILIDALTQWTLPETFQEIKISDPLPNLTLVVDSSQLKWGASLIFQKGTSEHQGIWSSEEQKLHINQKELLAILRALENLPKEIKDSHISIQNDNQTTVSTLRKLGSCRSAIRQKITAQILQILTKINCTFEVHHIPGVKNVLADFLSRHPHLLPSEAQISKNAFFKMIGLLQLKPEIDLFATRFNRKLGTYHSSIPDKEAETINTFTSNWGNYKTLYAFPPPSLIHKVLFKWNKEKQGTMILVAPDWPTQTWYSPLQIKTLRKIKLQLHQGDLLLKTISGEKPIDHSKFHLTAHIL